MPEEKKVDEAWKEQARKEREQGGQQEAEAEPKEPQAEAGASPDEAEAPMPEPEISVIISSLATQALIGLGVMGHPISKKKEVDTESAKFSIDLLQVLQDKTKGNLTDLEKRFLETLLHDLRMKFVEATSK